MVLMFFFFLFNSKVSLMYYSGVINVCIMVNVILFLY